MNIPEAELVWLGLFIILFSTTPGLSAVEGFHVGLRLL